MIKQTDNYTLLTATGEVITSVSVGGKKDVDLAVDAAKKVRESHLIGISIY